jgi:WS/DGAT/MGAT family acyltransferase
VIDIAAPPHTGPRDNGCVPWTRLRMDELANAWVGDPDTPFQIGLLSVFEGANLVGPDGSLDVARIRAELARRAAAVPALVRRVLWTRPGTGRPVWVPDPAFDAHAHVDEARLPRGAQLYTWVANRVVRPLDPERPLWRAEVIDGLPDGRFAVLIVVHHIVADGAAGLAIAASLFDATPAPAAKAPVAAQPVSDLPRWRELVADRLRRIPGVFKPRPKAPVREPRARRGAFRVMRDAMAAFPGPAPATSLPRQVGPGRRMVVVRRPLRSVRHTGHVLDATVTDLLLAAVTGGMRELLIARSDCVDGLALRTILPAATGDTGQVVGMLVVDLPVGEPDPRTQLAMISTATTASKQALRAGAGNGTDLLRLPVPLARLAVKWGRRFGSRRLNLSVTAVPGPTEPLWLAGSPLVEAVPIAPLVPLVGMSVVALSYAGDFAVSVNADSSIAELDVMADGMGRTFDALFEVASRWEP